MLARRLLVAVVVLAGCTRGVDAAGSSSLAASSTLPATTAPADPSTTSATSATTAVRVSPVTPTDPTRISAEQWAAIDALGASTAGPPHGEHQHGHDMSVQLEIPLFNGDSVTFAQQWVAAQRSTADLDTTAKAAALGYVRASSPGPGVGTHWVLWSQVAEPFDPAHPAMLLFDERKEPAVLVGYSYWLQSPTEPVGFAGGNDHWHQHTGLCVVNGWVDREEAASPQQCAGTFLAGGDLWMLHAWVVPTFPDKLGRFATFNPNLCPSAVGTPDISRCPE